VTEIAKKEPRRLELDALRGFAALSVLWYHYTTGFGEKFGHADPIWCPFPVGHHGVTLFFMISGFVILMTLDRCKAPMDFVVARFARLYPAYWVAVLLTFAVVSACGLPEREHDVTTLLVNLTMIQGLFRFPNVDGVYWSLLSELLFYGLIWGVVTIGFRKRLNAVFVALIAVGLVFSVAQLYPFVPLSHGMDLLLFRHLHLFFVGIVLYQMRSGMRARHGALLAVCLLAAIVRRTSWLDAGAFSLLAAAVFLASCRRTRLLTVRPLVFFGTISYPLYLLHQYLGYVVIRAGYERGWNGNVSVAAASAIAILVASILTFTIERPANVWLRAKYKQWKAGRSAAPVVEAAIGAPGTTGDCRTPL